MKIKLRSKRTPNAESLYWRIFFSQIKDIRLVGLFNSILIHLGGSEFYHKFVCGLGEQLRNPKWK
jgi:hypothetical protein